MVRSRLMAGAAGRVAHGKTGRTLTITPLLLLLLCAAVLVRPAGGDIVTDWNQTTLMLNPSVGTQMGGRNLGMVHTAMYDAVMAFDGTYAPYQVTASPPAGASREAAATAAAYSVLSSVFTAPAQQTTLQNRYNGHLTQIADGPAKDAGIAFGQSVAQSILALRSTDGAAAALTTPHLDGTQPGEWRRTASGEPVAPGWGNVTPWAMTAGNQFDQGGPPALSSQQYADAYNETVLWGSKTSALRTADQSNTVKFWADHVPAKWYAVARDISGREGLSLAENARLFGLLSLTIADANIAGWNMKYSHNFWRPETAIHLGDSDTNDVTVGDPAWEPFIASPAFPEYVSGHSITSAAAARLLEFYFQKGDYSFQLTAMGMPDPRTFNSFWQAAEEAGRSRIYGGIHFEFSNQEGLQAGNQLANYVFGNFMVPEPATAAMLLLGITGFFWRRRPSA